jgi:hypothetical protein
VATAHASTNTSGMDLHEKQRHLQGRARGNNRKREFTVVTITPLVDIVEFSGLSVCSNKQQKFFSLPETILTHIQRLEQRAYS